MFVRNQSLLKSYSQIIHNSTVAFNCLFKYFRVALEMVTQKNQDSSICRKQSLLEQYLKNENLDIKDVVGMACDMLLAGVDTVSFSKLIICLICNYIN